MSSPVSPASEAVIEKLREAMHRLLTGKARVSTGKLTKKNLALEAGVSEATLYRAPEILREWDEKLSEAGGKTVQVRELEDLLKGERQRNRDLTLEIKRLRDDMSNAAAIIAELHARLETPTRSTVIPLDRGK